jgi:trans-2,3-dihydro-3-hydroxyanthranilate isomerase
VPAVNVPFRLVDVFTPRPLAGNQLCVVPEPGDLDDAEMQSIAKEIFTPGQELPFAGHPTLGTAFVLVSEGRVSTPATQVIAAGEIPVEVDVEAKTAWMTQLPAELGPVFPDRDLIASAIGLTTADLDPGRPVQTVSTGLHTTIVPLRDLGRDRSHVRFGVRNRRGSGDRVRGRPARRVPR